MQAVLGHLSVTRGDGGASPSRSRAARVERHHASRRLPDGATGRRRRRTCAERPGGVVAA
jgi:hypothetical protein